MSRFLKSLQKGEGRGAPMTIHPVRTSSAEEDVTMREANPLVPPPEGSAQGADDPKLVSAFVATGATEVTPNGMSTAAEGYAETELTVEPVMPAAPPLDHQGPSSESLLSGLPPASAFDECVDDVVDDGESDLTGIQLESDGSDQADSGRESTVHQTMTLAEIVWKAPDVDQKLSSFPIGQIASAAEPAETEEKEKPATPETFIDEGLQPPSFIKEVGAPVSTLTTDEQFNLAHMMPLANIPPPPEAEEWSLPHDEGSATPTDSTVIVIDEWLWGDSDHTDTSRPSEEYQPNADASMDDDRVADRSAVALDSQLAAPDTVDSADSANEVLNPVAGSTAVGGEERLSGTDTMDGDIGSNPRAKLESLLVALDDPESNVTARDFVDAVPGSAAVGHDERTYQGEVDAPGPREPYDVVSEPVWSGTGQVLKEGEEQAHLALSDPLTDQAYQVLRVALKQRVFADTPCALSLVGVESEADIAESVLQLGILFAKNEDARVLIVDANFTSKILSHRLRGASGYGLCEVLQGSTSYANAVLACHTPGLSFLPAGNGGFPRQPSVLRQLPKLLLRWKSFFGAIMIDAGGIHEQAAKTFVRWCDASCFVLPMNVYTPDEVSAAAEALHQHGARLMGSILTNTPGE